MIYNLQLVSRFRLCPPLVGGLPFAPWGQPTDAGGENAPHRLGVRPPSVGGPPPIGWDWPPIGWESKHFSQQNQRLEKPESLKPIETKETSRARTRGPVHNRSAAMPRTHILAPPTGRAKDGADLSAERFEEVPRCSLRARGGSSPCSPCSPSGLRVAARGSGPGLRPPLPCAARRGGRRGVGTGAVPTFNPQEAPSRRPGSNRSLDKRPHPYPPSNRPDLWNHWESFTGRCRRRTEDAAGGNSAAASCTTRKPCASPSAAAHRPLRGRVGVHHAVSEASGGRRRF